MLIVDCDKTCHTCFSLSREKLKNSAITIPMHFIAFRLSREIQVAVGTYVTIKVHGGSSFLFDFPAAHGLGASCSHSPWLSTHAALVLQNMSMYFCSHWRCSFKIIWPAAHGLGTTRLHSPWFPSHAALVSFKKHWPTEHTEHTENTEKNISAHFFRTQFITLFQSPKPAQGMIHTLSLAPLGF
ncbi:MAG: hypothetical protein QG657_4334, partial [Acidobacteriota bacterium]|nr:hypothetical protein [Acidobacteriota bacterium]